jgi:metal-responsive CopG/Arc/MetJ family transcriptional regulator
MKTTKSISVSLPTKELRDMERRAKQEKRTMSELVRELYRRYVSDVARQEFDRAVAALRNEASGTAASRLTMRQMDAGIAASRRGRRQSIKSAR